MRYVALSAILLFSCTPAFSQHALDPNKTITLTIADLQKLIEQAVAHDRANMADASAKEANDKLRGQISPVAASRPTAPKDDKK